jgi:hypothetical protein
MVGGDLHWIWEPYGIYQEVDYVCLFFGYPVQVVNIKCTQVYGVKALLNGDGFTNAQCELKFSGYRQY